MKTEVYEVRVEEDGIIYWYQNSRYHRADGPAVQYPTGTKEWYQNGQRHRESAPAIERADGTKGWYQNNQLHRTDGPAVEYADGRKYWYIKGIQLAEQEFNKKMNPPTCNGKTVEIDGVRYKLSII